MAQLALEISPITAHIFRMAHDIEKLLQEAMKAAQAPNSPHADALKDDKLKLRLAEKLKAQLKGDDDIDKVIKDFMAAQNRR